MVYYTIPASVFPLSFEILLW